MELKTLVRVHGSISEKHFSSISLQSVVTDNNKDDEINNLFDQGWQLVDMSLHFENNVLFDVIYLVRDDEDIESSHRNFDTHDSDDDDFDGNFGSDLGSIFKGL